MKSRHLLSLGLISTAMILCGCLRRANQSNGRRNEWLSVSSQSPSAVPAPTSAKRSQAERIDKTWSSKFKFRTKSIEKKHEGNRGYEISVDYPQIAGARMSSTRRFNRWIRMKIRGYVAEFKGLERAAEIHDKRKRLPSLRINESLDIDYRVYYSDDRLISLRLTHTVMAIGQMHPIDYYETINYLIRKGRELQPPDVFRPKYLKVFSTYSRSELKEKYNLEDEWSKRGTMPKEHNFKNWNLLPTGILLSFEDYQVSSHSFGQPEMIVPYSHVRGVLRSGSVLKNFMKLDPAIPGRKRSTLRISE